MPSEIVANVSFGPPTTVYVYIDSANVGTKEYYPSLLESGGKSSWGNKDVVGCISIMTLMENGKKTTSFGIVLSDRTHGIVNTTNFDAINRSKVELSDGVNYNFSEESNYCRFV